MSNDQTNETSLAMVITSKVKISCVELTIQNGDEKMRFDIWEDDSIEFKEMLKSVINDIDVLTKNTTEWKEKI
jgi:hypothetical protein